MPLNMLPEPWPTMIAVVLLLGLGVVVIRRLRDTDDDDVSTLDLSFSTSTGSTTVLLSSTHLVAVGVITVAWLTWPTPTESPGIGALLIGLVAVMWFIERSET